MHHGDKNLIIRSRIAHAKSAFMNVKAFLWHGYKGEQTSKALKYGVGRGCYEWVEQSAVPTRANPVKVIERREMLKTIKARRWNTIGQISRRENCIVYGIIEEKIEGKRDQWLHSSIEWSPMLQCPYRQSQNLTSDAAHLIHFISINIIQIHAFSYLTRPCIQTSFHFPTKNFI
jgi:hypothetical protein